ncbi:hypothetical protein DSM107133_03812 (plasmid) [Pseudosulfitobacter sp. DSM 107133]|nr:hypothetical protein DSM107133_03812 [Pseudosulfitobacter sp. DSM 107133]
MAQEPTATGQPGQVANAEQAQTSQAANVQAPQAKPQQAANPAPQPAAKPAPQPAPPPPAKPAGKPVATPARQAFARKRHFGVLLSFLICVLVPSVVTGVYLYSVAVDQYASKVGFSVRREDASSTFELLGGLTNFSNSSSSDTDILYEFIQSQELVADIDAELDLRGKWSKPKDDFVFAVDPDAPIEDLLDYWNRMVRISYGAGAGLIEVEVLAFSAEDATAISRTLFEKSSDMINELSDIARQDGIRYAREELDEALVRLKDARAVVTRFRNENQIVNPEIDIKTQSGLIGNLQAQQAQTLIEIDLLRGSVNESDPRLLQATRRLEVIENRIAQERKKLGVGGAGDDGTAFADLLGNYERLVVDREFAEKSYVSALASYDGAVAESRRKTRYLAAYLEPTKAETAVYPKRFTILALVTLFLTLIWSVLTLVTVSVRDRR